MLKVKKLLHSLNFLDVFILVCLVFFFSLLFFGNTGIIAINFAEDFFLLKIIYVKHSQIENALKFASIIVHP